MCICRRPCGCFICDMSHIHLIWPIFMWRGASIRDTIRSDLTWLTRCPGFSWPWKPRVEFSYNCAPTFRSKQCRYSLLHLECRSSNLKTQIDYLVLYVILAHVPLKKWSTESRLKTEIKWHSKFNRLTIRSSMCQSYTVLLSASNGIFPAEPLKQMPFSVASRWHFLSLKQMPLFDLVTAEPLKQALAFVWGAKCLFQLRHGGKFFCQGLPHLRSGFDWCCLVT